MSKKGIKKMVDSIVSGDLSQANAEFDTVLQAKRTAEWDNAKLTLARSSFDNIEDITPDREPKVTYEPVDTGITGEPEEKG